MPVAEFSPTQERFVVGHGGLQCCKVSTTLTTRSGSKLFGTVQFHHELSLKNLVPNFLFFGNHQHTKVPTFRRTIKLTRNGCNVGLRQQCAVQTRPIGVVGEWTAVKVHTVGVEMCGPIAFKATLASNGVACVFGQMIIVFASFIVRGFEHEQGLWFGRGPLLYFLAFGTDIHGG